LDREANRIAPPGRRFGGWFIVRPGRPQGRRPAAGEVAHTAAGRRRVLLSGSGQL